jgi:biopolymer transport protein ExbB/TolQ
VVAEFVNGWGLTVVMCVIITLVFIGAALHLRSELLWVRTITDHLGLDLVDEQAARRQVGLELEAIRDEAHAVLSSSDAAAAQKQVRSWQMRAFRIEPALSFYSDLLKQLGLLGTVLGLGLSLATTGEDVAALLGPLALAVWTTVFGLLYSIVLSAIFGVKLNAWVDACEKNIEAWDARRRTRHVGAAGGGGAA